MYYITELRKLAFEFLPKLNEMISKSSKPKQKDNTTTAAVSSANQDPDRPSEVENMTNEEEAELSDLDEFDKDQPPSR